MTEMLEGVFTALVTPFKDGGVDWDAYGGLIDRQIDQGIHGIVPCGTTGESPTLSHGEHNEVVAFAVERSAGRVPVIAGTGSNSTNEAVEFTQHAKDSGVDAALVVLPYYNRPSPNGVVEHFKQLSTVGLPMVVYNIPSRCGIGLDIETYRRLEEIPGVVCTKEAAGDLGLVDQVLTQTSLQCLSGDDAMTLPFMALGAHGVISVISNLAPRAMVDLYDYMREGKIAAARELHRRLLPVIRTLFVESNPAPIKAALAMRGAMTDSVRAPLVGVQDSTRARLAEVVGEIEDLL